MDLHCKMLQAFQKLNENFQLSGFMPYKSISIYILSENPIQKHRSLKIREKS